jgi:hypothetical protein
MRVPVKISAPKVTDQLLQPILVDILEMRVPFKISVTKVTDQQPLIPKISTNMGVSCWSVTFVTEILKGTFIPKDIS